MLGARSLRDQASPADREPLHQTQGKANAKGKEKQSTLMDHWVEPPLSEKPSYDDHHGTGYGVLEHMQPLGEAPSVRVKTRVKQDGGRKSVMGKSAALAAGSDVPDTPEGTPVPPAVVRQEAGVPLLKGVVVDDERDMDYAPGSAANGKKKKEKKEKEKRESLTRARATKRRSEAKPTPPTPIDTNASQSGTPKIINKNKKYGEAKLKLVVDAAVSRAQDVGKPDLASAVRAIHEESLTNERLTELLEAILTHSATAEQTKEFQSYVKAAKRRLRDAKDPARHVPDSTNSGLQLPLRSPAKVTPAVSETKPKLHSQPSHQSSSRASARPSTESPASEQPKPKVSKLSLKVNPPGKKRLLQGGSGSGSGSGIGSSKMSASPKKRSGSVGSDSSLTSMTSNGEDDLDDGTMADTPGPATGTAKSTGLQVKDHAAERGSLTAPARGTKRASTEVVDPEEEERDRAVNAKKQKLRETIKRDPVYQESNVREPPAGAPGRTRSLRGKSGAVEPAPMSLAPAGATDIARGDRVGSDSPLSDLTQESREGTPRLWKGPAKKFTKKAKTKQSPEKKQVSGISGVAGASGAGRESPIGDDDNEEGSENNDFCSACGASGYLLCCDGCDRSFHFECLDPPLGGEASELNEPWYCFVCVAKRPVTSQAPEKPARGIFAPLFSSLKKRNPSNFLLPADIREHFEGVGTDKNGSFLESVNTRTRSNRGWDELPDYTKTKDPKGHTILCYLCGKSSEGHRQLIQCDFCSENWHLDCLNPPLANPPARGLEGKRTHDWMCPLHAEHELRRMDVGLLQPQRMGRKIHLRRPKAAKVVESALRRGVRNNGLIDVVNDDVSDEESDSEFYEEDRQEEGVVLKMPASGIKLDFIQKVKDTRIQRYQADTAFRRAAYVAPAPPRALDQANFARRSFREQQTALNLAQFASKNDDLGLGSDRVQDLVGTLIAEAPEDVVSAMTAVEDRLAKGRAAATSASSVVPPSPPVSEQTDALGGRQKRELLLLQELIRRKLGEDVGADEGPGEAEKEAKVEQGEGEEEEEEL